jgi:predicted nuclease with TOPRIM domain
MAEEKPRDAGGGVLAGLLAPLRLPERVIEALESLAEAGREVGPMRKELTRVREQTEPLAGLMPAVERLIEQTEPVPEVARNVERIREEAKPLAELLPALDNVKKELSEQLERLGAVIVALEGEESHLNTTAGKLVDEVFAMHATVSGLQKDVQSVTERLPDASKGPLEKARDVLSSGPTNKPRD